MRILCHSKCLKQRLFRVLAKWCACQVRFASYSSPLGSNHQNIGHQKLMGDISVARPIFYIVNACDDNVSEEESANSASCSHFVIMKFMSRRPKQTPHILVENITGFTLLVILRECLCFLKDCKSLHVALYLGFAACKNIFFKKAVATSADFDPFSSLKQVPERNSSTFLGWKNKY